LGSHEDIKLLSEGGIGFCEIEDTKKAFAGRRDDDMMGIA
jgi:hypothetical protein